MLEGMYVCMYVLAGPAGLRLHVLCIQFSLYDFNVVQYYVFSLKRICFRLQTISFSQLNSPLKTQPIHKFSDFKLLYFWI